MALEEAAHAITEALGREARLEHREHRGTFVIRDGVEGTDEVVLLYHRIAHAPRARQPIELERPAARPADRAAGIPFRAESRRGLVAHPGGEGLVQPDVV